VADGDDFEVFGVDGERVVFVAIVFFGKGNELVGEASLHHGTPA
jgi:hypothetical protein